MPKTDKDREPRPPRRMRLKTKLILALVLIAVVAGAFFAGALAGGREDEPTVTSDLLSQELLSVQELVSVEYHYTNMGKFENQVDFYGWKVPFTTKSFLISYDGVIKAGVDLSAAEVTVNETAKTVTVTLPEGTIVSHEIPEDSIQVFDETKNIFNPITIEDYTSFTQDQKASVEADAVANGLLDSAKEKAQLAVESLLVMVPGMEAYTLTVK